MAFLLERTAFEDEPAGKSDLKRQKPQNASVQGQLGFSCNYNALGNESAGMVNLMRDILERCEVQK